MRYLSAQEIFILHARVIEETGGLHGIRDIRLLAAAAERPKMRFAGQALYPTVWEKAAAYFDSLIRNHVFIDGNKRTAVLAAARFLFSNGYELGASNRALEQFTIRVAKGKLSVPVVASWFKEHSRRIRR